MGNKNVYPNKVIRIYSDAYTCRELDVKEIYIIYNIVIKYVTKSAEKELTLRGNSTIPLVKTVTKTQTCLTLQY